MAVLSQERENAARCNQLPDQRPSIQQLSIRPRNPLHHNIIPRHTSRSRQTRPTMDDLFSALLGLPKATVPSQRRIADHGSLEIRSTTGDHAVEDLVSSHRAVVVRSQATVDSSRQQMCSPAWCAGS